MTNFIKGNKEGPPGSKISQFHSMLIVTFNELYTIYKLIQTETDY